MSEAEKNKEAQQDGQNTEEKSSSSKGGMMKIIMISGIAIVCIGVGVFVSLMLMGGEEASHPVEEGTKVNADSTHAETTHSDQIAEKHDEFDSLFFDENDPSVIEMIEQNLAALDWDPNEGMTNDDYAMTTEDSIETVNWVDAEKKKLAKRENEVANREKELTNLDFSISKKILRIEQEESSRTSQLAKLYDGMDSRSVAQLMANLDDGTIVSILPKMKSKNASAVLQLLPPQRAARLSKQMITIAEK